MSTINYVRRGSGPPLLLLHGIGDRWQAWEPVLDRLAAHRDVIAIDEPGFGASPLDPSVRDIPTLATAIGSFITGLGLDRPHVAGNSMGGAVALQLGLTGYARSVAALSPAGFASARESTWARMSLRTSTLAARHGDAALPLLAGNPVTRSLLVGQMYGRPWRLTAAGVAASARALAQAPGVDVLLRPVSDFAWTAGDLPVPTTIAWGTHDWLLLPRQARRAARRLPAARHISLPGLGHVPMSDDPEQVTQVLLDASTA